MIHPKRQRQRLVQRDLRLLLERAATRLVRNLRSFIEVLYKQVLRPFQLKTVLPDKIGLDAPKRI